MEPSTEIYFIAVLVLLLTVVVGISPNFFEIYNKVSKKINAPFLIAYFFLILFLIILMMIQTGLNDQAIKIKDDKIESLQKAYALAYKLQQDSSTDAIRNGIEVGNRKTYDTIAFVFKQQGLLPVTFTSLQAYPKNNNIGPVLLPVFCVSVVPFFPLQIKVLELSGTTETGWHGGFTERTLRNKKKRQLRHAV